MFVRRTSKYKTDSDKQYFRKSSRWLVFKKLLSIVVEILIINRLSIVIDERNTTNDDIDTTMNVLMLLLNNQT